MKQHSASHIFLFLLTVIALLFLGIACGKKFSNPDGNEFLNAAITASPLTVAADSLVTIGGLGFSPNVTLDQVFFNGVGAAVLQASSTQLVVKVPATGSTGNITVRVNGEQASGPVFTYPSVSAFSINPVSGIGGTTVTLTSKNGGVGPAGSTTVSFGNLPGKVIYTDSLRIIVQAPDSVKTSQLTINTSGKQYPGPVFNLCTVTSVSLVAQTAKGGMVTIAGTGFNPVPGNNSVTFTTTPASQAYVNGYATTVLGTVVGGNTDTLIVNIPTSAGNGPIWVSPNGQNTIAGPVFTLMAINTIQPYAAPYITSSGFLQLMTGSGFNPDLNQNHLTVNGLACKVTYVSPTGDTIFFYPPDLVNPPHQGAADGPIVLQSGSNTTSFVLNWVNGLPLYGTYDYQEVSTLAGGSYGLADGNGRQAQFETLSGIVQASDGNLYVTDKEANNIRKITPQGNVTLVAGSPAGMSGYQDGIGATALFNAPCGLAADQNGNLYIADSGNFRIRQINLSTYQVTTLFGSDVQGTADGTGNAAQFQGPVSITVGKITKIVNRKRVNIPVFFVMDVSGGQGNLRELYNDGSGTVTTIKSGLVNPGPVFFQNGITAYASNQQINYSGSYIAGQPGITGYQNGFGTAALFNQPSGLSPFSGSVGLPNPFTTNYYLVSDQYNNVLRAIDLRNGYNVMTYAGGMGGTKPGFQDGGYQSALFNQPGAIAAVTGQVGNTVTIYICDIGNHAIRALN